MSIIQALLCAVTAYLVGSFNSGIILSTRLGKDIRTVGSHNPGASNMLRVFGTHYGIATFLLDILKAAAAMGIGTLIAGQNGAMVSGLFVVIGHDWPVFYSFKGGKGVACSAAVYVLLFPWQGIPSALLAILVITFTRFISLGSIILSVVFLILSLVFLPIWPVGCWAALLTLLCIFHHRGNITRLMNGTERKIGEKEDSNGGKAA